MVILGKPHIICYLSELNPHRVDRSGVNDKPVSGFSVVFGINNKIRKEYLGTGH